MRTETRRQIGAHLVLALSLGVYLYAQQATPISQVGARLDAAAQVSTIVAAGTLTLTPNGGENVVISEIDVQNCGDATGATAAAQTNITTTNLAGSPIWQMSSGSASATLGPGGCFQAFSISYPNGLRSNIAGTAVTFVIPTFAVHQTIRLNVAWASRPIA